MRLPDFIIAGAPRSGTTWLYEMLDRHPAIYMAKPLAPEPKFFLVDDLYAQGLERYARWFDAAGDAQVAGEKSTDYLESRAVASGSRAIFRGVKLVFILREPASRAYSNYLWSRMNGKEDQDFETALALEGQREQTVPHALRFARPHAVLLPRSLRGFAAAVLRPVSARADAGPALRGHSRRPRAPGRTAARVLSGDAASRRRHGARRRQRVREMGDDMPQDARRALEARYAQPNRELAALLGPEFQALGSGWTLTRSCGSRHRRQNHERLAWADGSEVTVPERVLDGSGSRATRVSAAS